ncbi:MAG: ATP-dependent Clp protease adapter ClpS, partial [Burkholderiaceae bacterium]|nr:ATP-dependent Clp protease adapter ClpS [Burkholderiaceae bacterium]
MSERLGEGAVVEKQASRVKPPPIYQVVLLNDDYTPMEFVVGVLQKFFGKGREQATQIMLKVHHEGRGVCGV